MACAHSFGEVCGECAQHTVEMLTAQSERFRLDAERLRAELADAHAAGRAEMAGEGWQPIATAPTDGTRVLVAAPGRTEEEACGFSESEPGSGGWFDAYGYVAGIQPTHWQPLPAPPPTKTGTKTGN